jgi:hypothetical protein
MKNGAKGKRKGSAFERLVAKDIVKAFKKFGITQKDCWRSTLSGGHERAVGDIEMSKGLLKLLPFSFECKHVKKVLWHNFLMSRESDERNWLIQAEDGSEKVDGVAPVLVVKGTNHKDILALVGGYFWDAKAPLISPRNSAYEWQLLTWTQFLKNAVKEANEKTANASP